LARIIALRTSVFLRLGMLKLQIQGLVDGIVPRSGFDFHSLKRAARYMSLPGGEPGAVEFVIGIGAGAWRGEERFLAALEMTVLRARLGR